MAEPLNNCIPRSRALSRRIKASGAITPSLIASVYGIGEDQVTHAVFYDSGRAVKITIISPCVAGDPGDGDVYGCQQHAPLLDVSVPDPIECRKRGFGLAAATVGFLVQELVKPGRHLNVYWTVLVVLLFISWAVLQSVYEMFTLVVYMKAVLMRRLRPLLETSKFLEFEWYLNRIRSKGWNRFDWQVGLAVPIVIGGVLVIWSIYNDIQRGTEGFWTFQNGIWLLIVLYQALMVVMKFIGVTYLQGRAMRKKRRPVRKKARAAVVSLTGE